MTQLLVLAHYTITAGREDVILDLVPRLAEASRSEPGCLGFDAYQKVGDRRDVMLIERYTTREAFTAHRDTPHFHELAAARIIPNLDNRTVETYDIPDPQA
jgi:quinol monooxygenase YgiN